MSKKNTLVVEALRKKFEAPFGEAPFKILEIRETAMPDVATVQIVAKVQNDIVVCSGSARRARGDDPNPEVGYMLALSRALESLTRKITRRANGMVKHMDCVAEHREEVAAKPRRQTIETVRDTSSTSSHTRARKARQSSAKKTTARRK